MNLRASPRLVAAVSGAAITLSLAAAPFAARGADHLDAPPVGLQLVSPNGRSDADINDLYVFPARAGKNTVLAMTTNPAAGVIAPLRYGDDVNYTFNVDRNGDAVQDLAYVVRFSNVRKSDNKQNYTITRYTGNGARTYTGGTVIGHGLTGTVSQVNGGGYSFAGLRSDPFFFDLSAFRSEVAGVPLNRTFCDANTNDFFAPLNTNGIVLQVPNSDLGRSIGVWAVTSDTRGRIDQMGRPAINTVFMHGEEKNQFNHTDPANQFARFHDEVINGLLAFSSLDNEGAYTRAQAHALAKILLPDVLTYQVGTPAAGPLNGRALSDDVIDVELNIVTGGYPFAGRDATGGIPSDCVGPHSDYMANFPYLGPPHR